MQKKHHIITVYTSPGSKFCELVRTYFNSQGIEFTEHDISVDEVARGNMKEISSQNKTPVVELDGRVIIGYQPDVYDLLLAGEPSEEIAEI